MKLGALAEFLGARLIGEAEHEILRVDAIERGDAHAIGFVQDEAYLARLPHSRIGALIVSPAMVEESSTGGAHRLIVEHPQLAFARVAKLLHPRPVRSGIHPTAVVEAGAQVGAGAWIGPHALVERGARIGEGARIGPYCMVGEGSEIGAGTELVARVTVLQGVIIGARCVIHPGAVIGSDGFGLAHAGSHWERVPQLGGVRIGDDVDIGANTAVDRGALDDTVIADGVKIDNLVQIAHNVAIGSHSAIAGCAGLAGSSRIGSHCMLAGGVGLAGHLELADGVQVTGMSMVTRSIHQPGVYSAGTPLDSNRNWRRNAARFKHLDDMARRLDAIERRLGEEDPDGSAG
ncbi:MAG: UDP-3-O-(3-hydroxymyristoyl)glucosamine N-acyltransferase [Pseudomonadota bacterium]